MSLSKSGALNHAKSNSEPGRREWWDLWGMAGDFFGGVGDFLFGGSHVGAPVPRPADAAEDEIVVTGDRYAVWDRWGFDGSWGYDGPVGRQFSAGGFFGSFGRSNVSVGDVLNNYGSALYHLPGRIVGGINDALNAPLYSERDAQMFVNISRSSTPTPTFGEFAWGSVETLTPVGPALDTIESHQNSMDALQAGDLFTARREAQNAIGSGGLTAAVALAELNAVRGPARGRIAAADPYLPTDPPAVFRNLDPSDIPRPANTIPNERLIHMDQRRLAYVVLEDGTLVVGKNGRVRGQGHIDLAQGQPVLAAGEFGVLGGELRFIDNASGHYRPVGLSAQYQAENAFSRLGFDVRGKYVERRFQ